jgi:hypothetical protein
VSLDFVVNNSSCNFVRIVGKCMNRTIYEIEGLTSLCFYRPFN